MSVFLPLTVCGAAFQSSSPCLSPSLSLSASLSYSRCVSARWFLRQAVMVATPPLHHVKFFFFPRYDFPMIGCWQQNSLPTGSSEYIFMNMNSTLQRAVLRTVPRTVLSTIKTHRSSSWNNSWNRSLCSSKYRSKNSLKCIY